MVTGSTPSAPRRANGCSSSGGGPGDGIITSTRTHRSTRDEQAISSCPANSTTRLRRRDTTAFLSSLTSAIRCAAPAQSATSSSKSPSRTTGILMAILLLLCGAVLLSATPIGVAAPSRAMGGPTAVPDSDVVTALMDATAAPVATTAARTAATATPDVGAVKKPRPKPSAAMSVAEPVLAAASSDSLGAVAPPVPATPTPASPAMRTARKSGRPAATTNTAAMNTSAAATITTTEDATIADAATTTPTTTTPTATTTTATTATTTATTTTEAATTTTDDAAGTPTTTTHVAAPLENPRVTASNARFAAPVELNPSVMVLGEFDWRPYQAAPPYTSRCTDMVDRSKAVGGGTRINFVPTHYWRDRNNDGGPDHFCFMDSSMTCVDHDPASIASFREGMELCFRRAVEEGMGISVVPHLDDGGRTAAWRNGLVFNPKQKYGGLSYQQIMLDPLIDALAAALAAKPDWVDPVPVWMALQGEMSATVLRYPREYTKLISQMRERLLSGMRKAGAPDTYLRVQRSITQVGVSFNFNKLLQVNTGSGLAGGGSAASALSRYIGFGPFNAMGGFRGRGLMEMPLEGEYDEGGGDGGRIFSTPTAAPTGRSLLAPSIDLGALATLFEEIDFLGISAYAALDDPDFPITALQNAAFTFFGEMRDQVGIDVAAIIRRRRIELHYSEFGLGGGASPLGSVAARTPDQAARMPFYGVWGAYRGSSDPWAPPQMRAFMHSFFRKTMDWLTQGGGPTYPISHCFLWSMGSWDVLGIYPESTTIQGSYKDPAVVQMVLRHNSRVVMGTAMGRVQLGWGQQGGSRVTAVAFSGDK